jgi:pyruvate decarboxylase
MILLTCTTEARPVYLTLPTDIVWETIPASRLLTPLSRATPPNDPDIEAYVLDQIVKLVEQADNNVIILVDACAIRHDARLEVVDLVKKTGFPVYCAPMGKTAIPEIYERYGGVSAWMY